MAKNFQLETQFEPTGDQPEAIDALVQGIDRLGLVPGGLKLGLELEILGHRVNLGNDRQTALYSSSRLRILRLLFHSNLTC